MENLTSPQVLAKPFAADGDKNIIPVAATGTNRASLTEGFPPITGKSVKYEGGIPPDRKDFNGMANLNSQFYFAFQNGWLPTFSAEVSAAIGGYALNAVLWYFANGTIKALKSTKPNNTDNFNDDPSVIGTSWVDAYSGVSGKAIGEVFYSQSSSAADVPGALPLFTGTLLQNAEAIYPDFYNWVKAHPQLCTTAADYTARITQYGECPFYVIYDAESESGESESGAEYGSIKLPFLKTYIKNANTTDGITQSAAGLPNITGTFSAPTSRSINPTESGAFIGSDYGNEGEGDQGEYGRKVTLDASQSSNIYGKSNTVTPQHTTLFPWVCAYNAAIPLSVAENQALLDVLINGGQSGGGAPTITWYKNNTGTTVTIADTSEAALVKVYKNGLLLEPTEDYSISGTTLTLTSALIATDKITTEVF